MGNSEGTGYSGHITPSTSITKCLIYQKTEPLGLFWALEQCLHKPGESMALPSQHTHTSESMLSPLLILLLWAGIKAGPVDWVFPVHSWSSSLSFMSTMTVNIHTEPTHSILLCYQSQYNIFVCQCCANSCAKSQLRTLTIGLTEKQSLRVTRRPKFPQEVRNILLSKPTKIV